MNKLTPTEISLQMADKSTAIPFGICEEVPDVVANVTILTDFVILDIPEDDSMSIILGRPFLNTAGDVIDCNKGNVTFHVNGNEHTTLSEETTSSPQYQFYWKILNNYYWRF